MSIFDQLRRFLLGEPGFTDVQDALRAGTPTPEHVLPGPTATPAPAALRAPAPPGIYLVPEGGVPLLSEEWMGGRVPTLFRRLDTSLVPWESADDEDEPYALALIVNGTVLPLAYARAARVYQMNTAADVPFDPETLAAEGQTQGLWTTLRR